MMDEREDKIDERLREAAQDYHRPPATPRDEMWAAIARQRALPRRVVRPWLRWGIGLAAVMVLGIAIGRFTVSTDRPVASQPAATADSGLAYRVAAGEYLSSAEVLLTGFRAQGAASARDPQVIASARTLLGTTRLMLDCPAGRDPRLRPLLEDLELVLAQIAQLPAVTGTQEMDLITQGLEQRSVLPRLRSAIPSGPAARSQGAL